VLAENVIHAAQRRFLESWILNSLRGTVTVLCVALDGSDDCSSCCYEWRTSA
jgi:hypothetical protein